MESGGAPLELGLQIAVEVCAAPKPAGSDTGARARGPSGVPRFLESAYALLSELSLGLDVRMVWLTSPSGVRLLVQISAMPEDLVAIHAAAAAKSLP